MNKEELFSCLEAAKRLHFIGIGGISMSTIAMFAKSRGYAVSGSDRAASPMTERLSAAGIKVYYSHVAENVTGADAVVYTAAVGEENPEMAYARAHDIPCISRAQFLGYIMCSYRNRIGVSGTHGKSTTTAMLTHIFLAAQRDPTVALGAELNAIGGAYRVGGKDDFIYESCEYKDSFLSFYPDVAVILNIDHDHVDYFLTMDQMVHSFAESIRSAHTVIVPFGDERVAQATAGFAGRTVTFGMTGESDFYPEGLIYEHGMAHFTLVGFGQHICSVSLHVPGEHNLTDTLAAAAAAHVCGVDGDAIAAGLAAFHGAHRRLEFRGHVLGADVYDDYAHHPTEIRATLSAVKSLDYRRVVCVFQPHTYSRTAELFDEFAHAFSDADEVIFAPIYSAREVNTFGISSDDLAAAVDGAHSFPDFAAIADYLRAHLHAGDLLLTMGAGDVYKIGTMLLGEEG